ncbi:MAG: restriction endonuclease subunit S [Turneriella sp.]
MREGWSKYRLGDIVDIKHGFAFKGENFSENPTEDILVTPGNFKIGGGFKADKFKFHSGEYPAEYVLKAGDIIVTMTDLSKDGDTLGYSAMVPESQTHKYLHNQRIGLLQFKNNQCSQKYVYWLLRTKAYQQFIVGSASGSTVKHTSPTRIQEYEFEAPPLPTQIRIAEILSSLDDKIELNRQINATLEATAQAIFKEWFVDFRFPGATGEMEESELGPIPKGWRVASLAEIANFLNGLAMQKFPADDRTASIPVIKIRELKNGVTASTDRASRKLPSQYIVKDGDLLFSWSGSLEVSYWVGGEGALNQHLFKVTSENFPLWFCYLWLTHHLEEFRNIAEDKTTTMGHIQRSHLTNALCLIPPNLEQMGKRIKPIIDQIILTRQESINTVQLRDLLLPKLMNAEIVV